MEQLLPINLIGAYGVLPLGETSQSAKVYVASSLAGPVLCRVQFNDIITVDQMRIALDDDHQRTLVFEAEHVPRSVRVQAFIALAALRACPIPPPISRFVQPNFS